ncbi:MAG: hypothetical protein ACOYON_15975 [Fimbriimonas sp.]
MKTIAIAALVVVSAIASAQSNANKLYIHGFRAPSTGLEYRSGQIGLHAGLYTTILDSREKSTEFLKIGATYYYRFSNQPQFARFESYLSAAYVRGLNRDYDKKDGGFFESGVSYQIGRGFEARLGTGLLVAKGFKPELNPTVGLTYTVPIR